MKKIALGMVVASLISTSAWAQEPTAARLKLDGALAGVSFATAAPTQAAAAEEESPVSVLVGADFPSSYFFRGFRQELEPTLTVQPFVDVAIAGESATFNVGVWNSLHTGSLKEDLEAGWYETDLYAAVTVGRVKATYTAYLYPRFDDFTIHELMVSASIDHVLAPSAAVAFEFSKASGADKGIYAELGIAPAVPMADDAPVSITIPIKVGLSLKDFYGEDKFGYVSAGVNIGKSISDAFEIHGSATVFGFGDLLKSINNDKAGQFVASVGASYGF